VRLGRVFPEQQVYAKCEHLAPSGSFKIRGSLHLLRTLTDPNVGGTTTTPSGPLVVPSMGNTALGCAEGLKMLAAASTGGGAAMSMVAVVPASITRAKQDKLRSMGIELLMVDGSGSAVLDAARTHADDTPGYMVHPHLDHHWTDGYQTLIDEVLRQLPECRSIVFPVGGGGLLMGLSARAPIVSPLGHTVELVGCEPAVAAKYAAADTRAAFQAHRAVRTIADGLMLDRPHVAVQERIEAHKMHVGLVCEGSIPAAMRTLYEQHGLLVEPSSAVPVAYVHSCFASAAPHATHDAAAVASARRRLAEPIVVVLTGDNIARDDFFRIIRDAPSLRTESSSHEHAHA